jgi:hypothetical protein
MKGRSKLKFTNRVMLEAPHTQAHHRRSVTFVGPNIGPEVRIARCHGKFTAGFEEIESDPLGVGKLVTRTKSFESIEIYRDIEHRGSIGK